MIDHDTIANDTLIPDPNCGHREETMHKVWRGLAVAGITEQQAIDATNAMQNEGVLFREPME